MHSIADLSHFNAEALSIVASFPGCVRLYPLSIYESLVIESFLLADIYLLEINE